jgi:hypothetical protein
VVVVLACPFHVSVGSAKTGDAFGDLTSRKSRLVRNPMLKEPVLRFAMSSSVFLGGVEDLVYCKRLSRSPGSSIGVLFVVSLWVWVLDLHRFGLVTQRM